MARRARTRSSSTSDFGSLPQLGAALPISTGTARVTQEQDGSVLLEVNGVPSSHLHPDPTHLVFEYMRWMKLVIDLHLRELPGTTPQLAHLGGAGCALPRAVAATHPGSRQIVVEIDSQLAEQVRDWFDLPRSPQLRIRIDDALGALTAWRDDRFDVLVRDVFSGSTTPDSLLTAEASAHAARVLSDGGVYLANCAAPPGTGLMADEVASLSTAFEHVSVIAEPAHLSGKRRGNCVLVASSRPLPDGIDRALRSDPVSVRLAGAQQVDALRRAGKVRG